MPGKRQWMVTTCILIFLQLYSHRQLYFYSSSSFLKLYDTGYRGKPYGDQTSCLIHTNYNYNN